MSITYDALRTSPYRAFPLALEPPLDMGPNCTGTPADMFNIVHYQGTYGWQAGGPHPTEMLPCSYFIIKSLPGGIVSNVKHNINQTRNHSRTE